MEIKTPIGNVHVLVQFDMYCDLNTCLMSQLSRKLCVRFTLVQQLDFKTKHVEAF